VGNGTTKLRPFVFDAGGSSCCDGWAMGIGSAHDRIEAPAFSNPNERRRYPTPQSGKANGFCGSATLSMTYLIPSDPGMGGTTLEISPRIALS
jgi:hypothetical protein